MVDAASPGKARVAVLISGRGSNMAALVYAAKRSDCPYEIVLVASNDPEAQGLEFARAEGIATFGHSHKGLKRAEFDAIIDFLGEGVDDPSIALARSVSADISSYNPAGYIDRTLDQRIGQSVVAQPVLGQLHRAALVGEHVLGPRLVIEHQRQVVLELGLEPRVAPHALERGPGQPRPRVAAIGVAETIALDHHEQDADLGEHRVVARDLGCDLGIEQHLARLGDLALGLERGAQRERGLGEQRRVLELARAAPRVAGLAHGLVELARALERLRVGDPGAGLLHLAPPLGIAGQRLALAQRHRVGTRRHRGQPVDGGQRVVDHLGVGLREQLHHRAEVLEVLAEARHPQVEQRLGLLLSHVGGLARVGVRGGPARRPRVDRRHGRVAGVRRVATAHPAERCGHALARLVAPHRRQALVGRRAYLGLRRELGVRGHAAARDRDHPEAEAHAAPALARVVAQVEQQRAHAGVAGLGIGLEPPPQRAAEVARELAARRLLQAALLDVGDELLVLARERRALAQRLPQRHAERVLISARVGVAYAGQDALLPPRSVGSGLQPAE